MAADRLQADADVAAAGRVLDRVVHEVREHLAKLPLVGGDGRDGLFRLHELDGDASREVRAGRVHDAACKLGRVAVFDVHGQRAGVELAREQQVVDDLSESRGFLVDHSQELLLQRRLEHDVLAT